MKLSYFLTGIRWVWTFWVLCCSWGGEGKPPSDFQAQASLPTHKANYLHLQDAPAPRGKAEIVLLIVTAALHLPFSWSSSCVCHWWSLCKPGLFISSPSGYFYSHYNTNISPFWVWEEMLFWDRCNLRWKWTWFSVCSQESSKIWVC